MSLDVAQAALEQSQRELANSREEILRSYNRMHATFKVTVKQDFSLVLLMFHGLR